MKEFREFQKAGWAVKIDVSYKIKRENSKGDNQQIDFQSYFR